MCQSVQQFARYGLRAIGLQSLIQTTLSKTFVHQYRKNYNL